jgi:hypothetical protein
MAPEVATALRAMVDAFGHTEAPIPEYQRLLMERLRLDADTLMAVPSGSLIQANIVRGALDVALLLALEHPLMKGSAHRVGLSVVEARQALERIDVHAPAREQHARIAEALLGAANAVALAVGRPELLSREDLALAHPPGLEVAGSDAGSLSADVNRLNEYVHALPHGFWSDRVEASTHALEALADALQRLGPGSRQVAQEVEEIRVRRRRIENLRSASLAHADELKGALKSGIVALRAASADRRDAWLGSWIDNAERATGAIDTRSPAGLQQAAIQDAFRTLADALRAAAQLRVAAR